MIVGLYPMVAFANRIAALIARGRPAARVSRSEIRAIADLGHTQGVIAADESRIIESVIQSGALAVRGAMTPRTVVVALDESLTLAEVAEADLRHSRIPIYRGSVDSVTGYVLRYELLLAVARGEGERTVESLRRDILPLPDTTSLRDSFSRMLSRHEHIALIVDQYGGTAGDRHRGRHRRDTAGTGDRRRDRSRDRHAGAGTPAVGRACAAARPCGRGGRVDGPRG